MNIQEFGASVKAKYPQYQNVDDATLGQQVLAKYPQYSRVIDGQGTQATQTSPQPTEHQPGGFQRFVQGVASPFLRTATNVLNFGEGVADLVKGDVQGANEAATKSRDYGYFGQDVRPIGVDDQGQFKNTAGFAKDVVGAGAEIGSYLTPAAIGTGAKTVARGAQLANMTKSVARPTLTSLARAGAASGAVGSAGAALQEDKPLINVAESAIKGGLLGGALGAAVPAVGRGISAAAKTGKEGLSSGARFASSQVTRLNPETAALAKAGRLTDDVLSKDSRQMTKDLVSRVQRAFDDRYSALKETGAAYDGIRKSGGQIPVTMSEGGLPDFVVNVLKKNGLTVSAEGKIGTTARSKVTAADLPRLQGFLDQYAKEPTLDADIFLNTRQGLDELANWDRSLRETGSNAKVARELRSAYDEVGKKTIGGLKELDEQYGPEVQELSDLRKLLYADAGAQRSGEIRATAYSDISNLLSTAKINKRTRLEKLVPGITEEVRVLKALEDIARAEGQKTGTYLASILGGGGLFTGNPALVAGSLLYGIFGTPKNFVKLLRQVGKAENYGQLVVEGTIQRLLKGQKLSEKSLELIRAAILTAQRGVVNQEAVSEELPE